MKPIRRVRKSTARNSKTVICLTEKVREKKRVEGEETKSEWVSCHGIHMQPATSFEKTLV